MRKAGAFGGGQKRWRRSTVGRRRSARCGRAAPEQPRVSLSLSLLCYRHALPAQHNGSATPLAASLRRPARLLRSARPRAHPGLDQHGAQPDRCLGRAAALGRVCRTPAAAAAIPKAAPLARHPASLHAHHTAAPLRLSSSLTGCGELNAVCCELQVSGEAGKRSGHSGGGRSGRCSLLLFQLLPLHPLSLLPYRHSPCRLSHAVRVQHARSLLQGRPLRICAVWLRPSQPALLPG